MKFGWSNINKKINIDSGSNPNPPVDEVQVGTIITNKLNELKIEERITKTSTALEATNNNVDALTGKMNELNESMTQTSGKIETLTNTTDGLNASLSSLKINVDKNTGDISTMKEDITSANQTSTKIWNHIGLGDEPNTYTGSTVKELIDSNNNTISNEIARVEESGNEIRHYPNLSDLEKIPDNEKRNDIIYVTDDTNGAYIWRPAESKFEVIANSIIAKDPTGNDITLDSVPNQNSDLSTGGSIDDVFSEIKLTVNGKNENEIYLTNLTSDLNAPITLGAVLCSGDKPKEGNMVWSVESEDASKKENISLEVDELTSSKATLKILKREPFSGKIKVTNTTYNKEAFFTLVIDIA